MADEDIRWIQRLGNYEKAFNQLQKAIDKPELSDLEKEGLIQRFEYTFELAWNVMKDLLEARGNTGIFGSKDAIRLAFKNGLIEEGNLWMEMVKSRVLSSQSYNEEMADELAEKVINRYFPLFEDLLNRMQNQLKNK